MLSFNQFGLFLCEMNSQCFFDHAEDLLRSRLSLFLRTASMRANVPLGKGIPIISAGCVLALGT